MILRILTLALALLLATTAHAHAGFIAAAFGAIAGAIGSTLAAGGIGAFLLQGALSIGLQFAGGLLKRALGGGRQREQRQPGVKLSEEVGEESDIGFVVGDYATPGTRKYVGTWGRSGKTPNAYLTRVLQVGDLPAPGRPQALLNGQPLTILWNETPAPQGYPVEEYRKNGKDHLWVDYRDGTETTASAFLVDKFGSHPDRPWQGDMIGRGCPHVILTTLFNRDLFQRQFQWLIQPPPAVLYDLRKDSTEGGDGLHRWANPMTWEQTLNPAIIIYNIIRGVHYDDGAGYREWLFGGQGQGTDGLPSFRLPASNWMAAANECDVLIDLDAGGQEAQFRCGYEVRGSEEPLAVIEELLKACSGRLAVSGGLFKILVGAPGAAVYSFTDADILITEGQSLGPFPTLGDTVNGLEARYPERAEAWALKDAPARYSSELEAADGDRRLATGIVFEAAPFGVQVQRLMKTMVEEERRFIKHSFFLPPEAWALEPNDVVSWVSTRNGYTSKKFLVDRAVGDRRVNQLVALKEIDPGEDYGWNPAVDEQPVSTGYLGPIRPPAQPMTGWQVLPAEFRDKNDNARRPSIEVRFAGDLVDIKEVRVQVRLAETDAIVFDGLIPYGAPGPDDSVKGVVLNGIFLPNEDYEVQGEFVPYSGRDTTPSAWLPVRTLDIRFGAADLYPIDFVQLGEDVQGKIDEIDANLGQNARAVRARIGRVSDLAAQVMEMTAADYLARDELRRAIGVDVGAATAKFENSVTVLVNADSALGIRIDSLSATVTTNAASFTAQVAVLVDADTALGLRVDNLTASVGSNAAAITNESQARATAVDALAEDITAVQTSLGNKADAAALTNLTSTVTAQGNTIAGQGQDIEANSEALTLVTAQVGDATAGGYLKMTGSAGPTGVLAQVDIAVRASIGGTVGQAAISLQAYDDGGVIKTRALHIADQFILTNGTDEALPFVFQGGVAVMNATRVNVIEAGTLKSLNDKVVFNLTTGLLTMDD